MDRVYITSYCPEKCTTFYFTNNLNVIILTNDTSIDSYDIFISYARKNERLAKAIESKIKELHATYSPDALNIFFDSHSIKVMDDWENRILDALKHSKVMVAILSPEYFTSKYCRKEWLHFTELEIEKGLLGEGIAFLYSITSQEMEMNQTNYIDPLVADVYKRQFRDVRRFLDETNGFSNTQDTNETLEEIYEKIVLLIEKSRINSYSRTTIPPHSTKFVGRNDLLRTIRNEFVIQQRGSIVVLRGLPGIGKSTLAYEYAHLNGTYYPGGRYLIKMTAFTNIRSAVVHTLASEFDINITEATDYEITYKAIMRDISKNGRALLIFDDVTDVQLFSKSQRDKYFANTENIHFCLTTRATCKDIEQIGLNAIEVTALDMNMTLHLLSKFRDTIDRNDEEKNAAIGIFELTGGYPIAIEIIGAYVWFLREDNYSFLECFEELKEKGIKFLDQSGIEGPDLQNNDIKIFSKLVTGFYLRLGIHEKILLDFCVVFPHDCIPEWWLFSLYEILINISRSLTQKEDISIIKQRSLESSLKNDLTEEEKEKIKKDNDEYWDYVNASSEAIKKRFNRALRHLRGYQLLTESGKKEIFQLHNLIHLTIKSGGDTYDKTFEKEIIYEFIFSKCEQLMLNNLWFKPEYRRELFPLMNYFNYIIPTEGSRYWGAITSIADAYAHLGDIWHSKHLLEKALSYINNDLATPSFLRSLKKIYQQIGDVEASEKIERQLNELSSESSNLSPRLTNAHIAIKDLIQEGKWDEATIIAQNRISCLENKTTLLLTDQRELTNLKNSLSIIYTRKGKITESIDTSKEGIMILESFFPEDSQDIALRYNNIAANYSLLLDGENTRLYSLKSLNLLKKNNLEKTKVYFDVLQKLAGLESNIGTAKDMISECIEGLIQIYGDKSPELCHQYKQLAVYELKLNNYAAAFRSINKAISIFSGVFGDDHPELIIFYQELYKIVCRYHISEEYEERLKSQMGPLLDSLGDFSGFKEESAIFHKIFDLLRINNLPEHTFQFGEVYLVTGIVHEKRKQYIEAVQALLFSYNINKECIGIDHTITISIIDKIESLIISHFDNLYTSGKILEGIEFLNNCCSLTHKLAGNDHNLTKDTFKVYTQIVIKHFDILPKEFQAAILDMVGNSTNLGH